VEPDRNTLGQFDLADSWWCSRLLLRRLRLDAWQVGAMALAGYYVLPMLLAACEGVLVSPSMAGGQFELMGLGSVGRWLSRHPLATAETRYYGGDLIHLAMALVTPAVGGTLMVVALDRFGDVFDYLARGGQLQVPDEVVAGEVAKGIRDCRRPAIHGVVILVSIVLGVFFLRRVGDPSYAWWWGHQQFGPAGVAFALVAAAMVWGGATAVYLLAVALRTVARLFSHPVTLRPFHSDGCNGFGRFGDYLMILFFLSVTIAASIWITFWGGYLGIERFVVTWIVGAGVLLAIPLILITPLVRCTVQIGRARQARLHRIEAVLDRALLGIERRVAEDEDGVAIRDEMRRLSETRKAVSEVYGSNNFPFKPRIAGTLSVGYLVQVALIAKEAVKKLTDG